MQKVIIIPGLRSRVTTLENATRNWPHRGLEPVIYPIDWHSNNSFEEKLRGLSQLVDDLHGEGHEVSLVGCSAGGSAALNLFYERRDVVKSAVNLCGRLRKGHHYGFRSFTHRTKDSRSFAESVELFESREKLLRENQRALIMTVRPLFGDEIVPAQTAVLEGARNITIPTLTHTLSIYLGLSLFSRKLISFLKS